MSHCTAVDELTLLTRLGSTMHPRHVQVYLILGCRMAQTVVRMAIRCAFLRTLFVYGVGF